MPCGRIALASTLFTRGLSLTRTCVLHVATTEVQLYIPSRRTVFTRGHAGCAGAVSQIVPIGAPVPAAGSRRPSSLVPPPAPARPPRGPLPPAPRPAVERPPRPSSNP